MLNIEYMLFYLIVLVYLFFLILFDIIVNALKSNSLPFQPHNSRPVSQPSPQDQPTGESMDKKYRP